MTNYETFDQWADRQIRDGHCRHWIRRNEYELKRSFELTGGRDLDPPIDPMPTIRNRYDEL